MQAQLCPRLLNEVIAIKRSLSMHIRFVRRAHAVRQTDSVLFCRLCCSHYGLNGRCICKHTLPFILPLWWQILAQTASVFDSISCCVIILILIVRENVSSSIHLSFFVHSSHSTSTIITSSYSPLFMHNKCSTHCTVPPLVHITLYFYLSSFHN